MWGKLKSPPMMMSGVILIALMEFCSAMIAGLKWWLFDWLNFLISDLKIGSDFIAFRWLGKEFHSIGPNILKLFLPNLVVLNV